MGAHQVSLSFEKRHYDLNSFDFKLEHSRKQNQRPIHSSVCVFWCYPVFPDCDFETKSQTTLIKHLRSDHAI